MEAELRLLDLVGAMEDLKAMRNSVLREIELQEGKGKQRTQKVQAWLDKVVDMDQRANQLMIDFSRCCVTGCCSLNIYSRLNASRKATKLKKELDELMKEKIHLSVLAKRRLSNPIINMPISTTNVGIKIGSNLCDVCNWLAAERVGIIGIYGMGGVGKSTLLKEIQRSKDVLNMGFDYIIHARASYELNAEDLRDCIAEQLQLCEPNREAIFKFLKYKNFLLLLDDLLEELDITVLGIPDPHDESCVTTPYKHKVVFTTRSKEVCDCMKADKMIKLECLDKDEGWQLLKENLAMDLEGMPFMEEAARKVASFCGGLPLALMMVGQAMSKKTATAEWNLMLDQLQGRLSSSLCESMFLYLKGSYDSLANKILQQCFLCFCLWPKKKLISTEDIIKCWLGFGLISCFDSLSEAYMHGCYILEILEEASLVVTQDNKRIAKVHELIHEMAQWIASRAGGGSHKLWFVRQNITLEQLSSEEVEAWFQLERVSVVNCNLNCLPELQFECPSLLSLNIQHNPRLENLPKIFLRQMPNLTYLNLSSTGIHKLPNEIITHLFNLEFLDISRTKIKSLPHEMGNLKKLKYLFCGYLFLGKLQAGLLSNLYSLQVLDLYPYGYVEPEDLEILRGFKGIGMCASSDEIFQQLSHLPIVNINIQEIEGLQTIQLRSLTSEGHGWPKEFQIRSCTTVQNLVITNGTKINLKFLRLLDLPKLESLVWKIEPKNVFPMLQLVQIEACHTLTSLHWVLHLPLLCVLVLKNCDAMEELVDEEVGEIEEDNTITMFPRLKYLTIVHLPKLVKISSCALDFPHLSKVHLEDCPNLKRLPFKPDIVNKQGLLIKCEKKWWEILEWDDATIQSQFCSNSTEKEEIAEFFVGNVPMEDEEIAEYFGGNVPTNDKEIVEFFVDSAPTSAQEGSPTISSSGEVREEDEKAIQFVNLFDEITRLKGEQSEVSFLEQLPPKPVPESYTIVGKKIVSNLDIARSYLADETVGIIGIWGMGGVGKTTLLKKIKQSLSGDANMGFNLVLFIEASKGIQVEELRKQIAERLNLKSSAGKEDIFNVLKISNFVLLLDNIWEEVDLIDLGIPHPYSDDNSTKQYKHKVIFTTRPEDVCAKMGAGENTIKVECLEEDEAWALFRDSVNLDVIESDEKFKEIAWQVMKKCGGLPLALKVVGKAMSNKKSVQDWKFILNSIKNSGTEIVQGVQESLLPILKFSYDNLTNDFKECFLSFCMLRRQSKHEIVSFWMGFGLISDFDNLQEAYGKGENILKTLEDSCLLYSSHDDYVRLHDVIYEMAVWIASDCGMNMNKWIVKEYDGLADEIPSINAENWRFASRVILGGKVELLPILSHQCPDLLCLMMQRCCHLENIPEGFFRQMPNLTYLNLQGTGIKKLPKDIKCLVNLQYLNISDTNISSLPKELVYLNKLQYLICRDLKGLGKVEDGLMSRLQKLKVIDVFPSGWVDLEQLKKLKKHVKAIGMRVVSKEVLQQLSCLPTAWLCLYNLDIISLSFDTLSCKNHGFLQSLQIESCPQLKQIVMNGRETHLNNLIILNVQNLQNIIWKDLSPPEFFHVLGSLGIFGCNLDNLAWVVHLPCLSVLIIDDCAKMETLFYIEEEREIQQEEVSEHRPTFPALIFLLLTKLPKLVSISNFALDFPVLYCLIVGQCLNLKKFPFKSSINKNRMLKITCEREWYESLEWDDATIKSHLRPDFIRYGNPNECTTSGSK